ncbi:MAG: protein kinase domain-containing protein [Fimbriiglobus sp.]
MNEEKPDQNPNLPGDTEETNAFIPPPANPEAGQGGQPPSSDANSQDLTLDSVEGPVLRDDSPTLTSANHPALPVDERAMTISSANHQALRDDVDERAVTMSSANHDALPSQNRTYNKRSDPTDVSMQPLESVPFIPGFEMIAEVGRGGMGVVYKAREFTLNRLVAIKMVIADRRSSSEELIRFRLEAETAARVRHPNVAQVFESNAHAGRPFLVMEWIDGGTLSDVLKSARLLPPRTAMELMIIVARAVHQIHMTGVIHRDLKPGNIMLARSDRKVLESTSGSKRSTGTADAANVVPSLIMRIGAENVTIIPKVTDFGLAKSMNIDSGLTETGRIMGTPEFMAPEQAAGQIRELCPASDVHALGVILYQMVVGHTPFRAESTYAVIKRVMNDEPKSLREVTKVSIPNDLEIVCMKCLRKMISERFQTAAELADDLQAILDNRPIKARDVGKFERFIKFTKRNPALAGLVGSCAASLVIGITGVTWQWREAVAARNEAEQSEQSAVVARDEAVQSEQKAVTARNEALVSEQKMLIARDEAIDAKGKATIARDQALRAQKTTDAVNNFLVKEMLASASPDKAQGRSITVLEVLDDAKIRLGRGLVDEPGVEAGIRETLGRSYRALGKPSQSIEQLQASIEYFRKSLGAGHITTLENQSELALAYEDSGDWKAVESLLNQIQKESINSHGEEAEITVKLKAQYGFFISMQRKQSEGLEILNQIATKLESSPNISPVVRYTIWNNFGTGLHESKRFQEALTWSLKAMKGRKELLGPSHPRYLESANNVAAIYIQLKQAKEAEKIFEDLVDDSVRVRGPAHIDSLSCMSNLAHAKLGNQKAAEAEDLFQRALEAASKSTEIGPKHPITLRIMASLALAKTRLKKNDESIKLLEICYTQFQLVHKPENPEIGITGSDLGKLHFLQGNYARATVVLQEALKHFERAGKSSEDYALNTANYFGESATTAAVDQTTTRVAYNTLTKIKTEYEQRAQRNLAFQLKLSELCARLAYKLSTQDPALRPVARELILDTIPLRELDKKSVRDADVMASKLLDIMIAAKDVEGGWMLLEKVIPSLPSELIQAYRYRAGRYALQTKHPKEALKHFDWLSEQNWSEHEAAKVQFSIGQCRLALGQTEEARKPMTENYELIIKSFPANTKPEDRLQQLEMMLTQLIALHEALDEPAEAKRYQEQLEKTQLELKKAVPKK